MLTEFEKCIKNTMPAGLYSTGLDIIQVNLGFLCNQACHHCHVQASPSRTEIMQPVTMDLILKAVSGLKCRYVELTGGAPELNPYFTWFVRQLRNAGHIVQVRTNLTVLVEPYMEETLNLLKESKIRLIASMPCYLEENVNSQRGDGVYEKSIEVMKRLNALGYGKEHEELPLDLVYNPGGPYLPPPQQILEADYKRELSDRFGIVFNQLLTIANIPIGRFIAELQQQQKDTEYRELLMNAFNPLTLEGLMCRHQISIGWDGSLYDCDFNLALGIGLNHSAPSNIGDFDIPTLSRRKIMTGNHCFGCTAGSGSSCSGSLV